MSSKDRERTKLWAALSAAVAEAADKPIPAADKAALVQARLRDAGFLLGRFDRCEVCGAATELPEHHARWHAKVMT